ncbi:hypothetical protein JOF28_000247 [Leucobacter exalbidus]|uniref:Uncharacterized protein n=1 Tax=Leucobacter exalbidus TaxID=662960 RepID=A0A940PKW3_9MICO|nr:hypothetical protein [Leucobacter exalbidus]MBP1325015.1 hypothetical protein [Leucobacter exalbidus]
MHRLTFLLTGENSYPRPEGLIAGLTQGSTRDLAHLILGEPVDATRDEFAADGIRVFLEFEAGGLSQISIEPTLQWTLPPGRLGRLLETLGTPEFSDAFVEVIEQTGGARRRHEILSGGIGRLIVWDAGLKVQVQDGNIAIAQVEISTGEADEPNEYARTLVPGMTWPATREQLHSAWGPPSATAGHADLYRYGRRELAVHFSSGQANATLVKLTAVMSGQNATMAMPSRSSGNYTIYLDLLGRPQTDATVVYARTQLGAHVQLSGTGRIVTAVEVDGSRVGFARFMDGWSNVARRSDVAFGAPDYYGAHDDVWWRAPGWIHVHSNNGRNIDRITVSQERPTRLDVHAWQFGRDSMEAWRSLSDGASVTE